jgi:ABC-type transporter Mla subunit MlaD
MVESGSSVQDWERFKDQLRQVGEQIAQVAQYLREGRGSREDLASLLDDISDLVGTTLPDSLVIS